MLPMALTIPTRLRLPCALVKARFADVLRFGLKSLAHLRLNMHACVHAGQATLESQSRGPEGLVRVASTYKHEKFIC